MTTSTKATTAKTVSFKSARGATYTVPTKYGKLTSVSAIIRAMSGDGQTTAQIAGSTGIRYQHVRNVLSQPLKTS